MRVDKERNLLERQELLYKFSNEIRAQRNFKAASEIMVKAVSTLTPFKYAFILNANSKKTSLRGFTLAGSDKERKWVEKAFKFTLKDINIDLTENNYYSKFFRENNIDIRISKDKDEILGFLRSLTGFNKTLLKLLAKMARVRVALTVPLYAELDSGEVDLIGILGVSSQKKDIDSEHLKTLEVLRNQYSLAVSNIKLIHNLRLVNRRYKESERETRALLEDAYDVIFVIDSDMKITYLNSQFESALGYKKDAFVEKRLTELVHPDDVVLMEKNFDSLLIKGGHKSLKVIRLVTHENKFKIFSIGFSAIMDKEKISHVIGIAHDISREKEMEKDLIIAKNKAVFYLDLMSHDIRNITQGAYTYLELLLSDPAVGDMQRTYISRAFNQVQSSSHLISNVLKLSKMEHNEFHLKKINLVKYIQYCLNKFENYNPEKQVRFEFEPNTDNVVAYADVLLMDLLLNLINNSVKYTYTNDVKIKLDLSKENVGMSDFYLLKITDWGCGIPDSRKNEIFNRFTQENYSTRGSGLGLTIVREIAQRYHWDIWVEDRIPCKHEKGSVFVLRIPTTGYWDTTAGLFAS